MTDFRTGIVEDRHDPKDIGRVRVRVHGVHTHEKNRIATPDLPWSIVSGQASNSGIGETSSILEGTPVWGFFIDDNEEHFVVCGTLPSIPSEVMMVDEEGREHSRSANIGFSDPRRASPGDYDGTPDGSYPEHNNQRVESVRASLDDAPRRPEDDTAHRYPLPDYIGKPSLNKLALGVKTWLLEERQSRIKGSEPASPYGAKYPYNRVYESESGHVVEYDDTPGAERVMISHRKGTFMEYHPTGDSVYHVIKDYYETIENSIWRYVGVNEHVDIGGDYTLLVNNREEGSRLYIKVTNGDMTIEVDNNISMKAGDNISIEAGGTISISSGSDTNMDAGGNTSVQASNIFLN